MNCHIVPKKSSYLFFGLLFLLLEHGCQPASVETPETPTQKTSQPVNSSSIPEVSPESKSPIRIVVMDPLAMPLSCQCVEGLGQRRYDLLAKWLQKKLDHPVEVVFDESLELAMNHIQKDVHFIIGKKSMVHFDAKTVSLSVRPIAALTDPTGGTDLHGIFVVAKASPLKKLSDLKEQTLVFGPQEDAETNASPQQTLKQLNLLKPLKTKVASSIDAAVFAVTDGDADVAVISHFLPPLLVGCGKIGKGDLRIIGQSVPVPFIQVFATEHASTKIEQQIQKLLLQVKESPELLKVLESKQGFIPLKPSVKSQIKTVVTWSDWRGTDRRGISERLPKQLPPQPQIIWEAKVTGPALAGIAATQEIVIVPDKSKKFKKDIFRAFDATNGKPLWVLAYDAPQKIEYTNSPRATPVIHKGLVYLQGALGDLHCVQLKTGAVVWEMNFLEEFQAVLPNWGTSSTPLIVDDILIINPGAKEASVVALNRKTGKVIWKTPGHAAAYGSFIVGTFGGKRQIIGYDVAGLAGWDISTGKRLWELIPPARSDFNVGTPVVFEGQILLATENNLTRLYKFDAQGKLNPQPVFMNEDLGPDTCSAVVHHNRLFCAAYGELFCLDMKNKLKTLWKQEEDIFYDHTNLIAGNNRLLAWTTSCDLVLLNTKSNKYDVVSRYHPFKGEDVESMSHPAIVGNHLYLRNREKLLCLRLQTSK